MDYPLRSGAFLTPGRHQVTMFYRDNTNDWNTLNASLNEDEYHLPQGLTGHAVDVGGYLGSVGIALALDNPELRVTIIEPVPPNCELIRDNIHFANVGDRVTLIEGAVGKRESVTVGFGYHGTETADHHAFVGNSTLGLGLPHDFVTYSPITLDALTHQRELAFLKVDCEGGEWDFLTGFGLDRVQTIVGEAHITSEHKGGDIVALLAATHEVTLTGDPETTCGFRAERRG
jgi:FkbM family methyltransferase